MMKFTILLLKLDIRNDMTDLVLQFGSNNGNLTILVIEFDSKIDEIDEFSDQT